MPAFVCVPARDEAALLPDLFAALAEQSATAGPWALCLLLDGCGDASREVAERLRRDAPFPVTIRSVASAVPNAGRARAAAMRMAERHAGGEAALFLTTDADSTPLPDWIASARASLATCDVATGRLVRLAGAPSQDRLERYYDRLYALRRQLDPVAWEPGPTWIFLAPKNSYLKLTIYEHILRIIFIQP